MRLTREQRARLFAGDFRPIITPPAGPGKPCPPPCEPRHEIVLTRHRPKGISDGNGSTYTPPSSPSFWITVTDVTRRRAGGWSVRFAVFDQREPRRMIRSVPPRFDPELMARDNTMPPTEGEIAAAADESFYTSNPASALDTLEAVDDAALNGFVKEAGDDREKARKRAQREAVQKLPLLVAAAGDDDSIDRQLRAILRQVQIIERKLGKAA